MRGLALIAVLLSVLGPALAHADLEADVSRGMAGLTAGIRAHDAKAIAKHLAPRFTNGGVWFPDAPCAKEFPGASEITGAEVTAFARCLARLELQLSTRRSASPDGAVLTAQPGFELELAFDGSRVRWIGRSLRATANVGVPMLTAQALESLRTQGTTRLDRVPAIKALAGEAKAPISAWIEVCLDATGTATIVSHHDATSPSIGEAFVRAASDWAFRPFVAGGSATPACSLSLLTYPAASAPSTEVLPPVPRIARDETETSAPPPPPPQTIVPLSLERLRLTGTRDIEPDPAMRTQMIDAGKLSVLASVKLCVDAKGRVSSATLQKSSGFEAYDKKILRDVAGWTYRPYLVGKKAVSVCTGVTFLVVPDPTMLNP
ncbi:MAG: TonB family protein [Myxococcales bacterium]|nr:TonB family protein [Myxococcales bacterium]